MRRSLTAKFVETAPGPKDGADRVLYWDASAPGFGLLIMGGGRRSWVFQYRHAGRSRRITWRTPSLAEARKQALEWRDKLDRGADPQGKRPRTTHSPRSRRRSFGPKGEGCALLASTSACSTGSSSLYWASIQ